MRSRLVRNQVRSWGDLQGMTHSLRTFAFIFPRLCRPPLKQDMHVVQETEASLS